MYKSRIKKIVICLLMITLPRFTYSSYMGHSKKAVESQRSRSEYLANISFDRILQASLIDAYQKIGFSNYSELIDLLIYDEKNLSRHIKDMNKNFYLFEYLSPQSSLQNVFQAQKQLGQHLQKIKQGLSSLEDNQIRMHSSTDKVKIFIRHFLQQLNVMCSTGIGQDIDALSNLEYKSLNPEFNLFIPLSTDPNNIANSIQTNSVERSGGQEQYMYMTLAGVGSFILGTYLATGVWAFTGAAMSAAYASAATGTLLAAGAWTLGISAVLAVIISTIYYYKTVKDTRRMADAKRHLFENQANFDTVATFFKKRCSSVQNTMAPLIGFFDEFHQNPKELGEKIKLRLQKEIKPMLVYLQFYKAMIEKRESIKKDLIIEKDKAITDEERENKINDELMKTSEYNDYENSLKAFNGDRAGKILYWVFAHAYSESFKFQKTANDIYKGAIEKFNYQKTSETYQKLRGLYFYLESKELNDLLNRDSEIKKIKFFKQYDYSILLYIKILLQSVSRDTTKEENLLRNKLSKLHGDIKEAIKISKLKKELNLLKNKVEYLISSMENKKGLQ